MLNIYVIFDAEKIKRREREMKKMIGLFASMVLLSGMSMSVKSFEFDDRKLFVGGGLGFNNPDSSFLESAIGYQFFGGYDFSDDVKIGNKIGLSGEIGYTNSGDFDLKGCTGSVFCSGFSANGLWSNAVFDYAVNGQMSALGRVGLDFGDDDGLMFGFGGGYKINDNVSARVEYVIRDNYSSLQGNVVYDF